MRIRNVWAVYFSGTDRTKLVVSRIADKICIVMQETGRADNLTKTRTFHIHHLGRLGTKQHHKAVFLLLLVFLSGKRKACHGD